MSFDPFAHSPDLARLVAEGYELELTAGGHLLVKQVPYRTVDGEVDRGTIVIKLETDGDVTVNPVQDHTIRFIGSVPCDVNGPLRAVINNETAVVEEGVVVNHHFSYKPNELYPDYYEKVTAHVHLISAEAEALDPGISAQTHGPCVIDSDSWPFEYVDSASGRAGLGSISGRLAGQRIAIVGLGGTGSYILDLVAKCPVDQIHLFDADRFSTHNAFRAPGAASLEELRMGQPKVEYLAAVYTNMKRGIVAHSYDLDASNVNELTGMTFVFLAMEGGAVKRQLVEALEAMGTTFVDCALGVNKVGDGTSIMGNTEITASTPDNRTSLHEHVDFGVVDDDDPYTENIQIAELNALNAVLAVLWWKKHLGVDYAPKPYMHQRLNVSLNRLTSE